jgi:CheY-like chemotaxis protein
MRAAFDCLSGESAGERAQGFARIGKLASEQQESMIAAILQTFSADLRSALEGNKEANTTPDLLHCATVAMATLSPAFEAKRVRLSLDPKIDRSANWRVTGEETRLRRVFLNLLENALRYSSAEGTVIIGLEKEGGTCTAFVDDEGPGLPDDLPSAQIFALLGKGKQGGGKAGLGLYFCKVTVERWGGTIGCAARPERGSRFWFRLPQAVDAAQAGRPVTSQISPEQDKEGKPAKRRTLSILFADDQEEIRTLTTHQLVRSGHKVRAVASGKEALKAVQRGRFDVVLLDEEMPGMSGVEVARAVREQASGSRQPPLLVAVTANSTAQDRERLLAAGFDEVVGKPFRLEAFNVILDGLAAHACALRSSREVEVPEEDPVEALSQRVSGDKKLMKKLIHRFLCDLPSRMNSLRRAVRRGDAHGLATHAHALKGTVSIFGAAQARARSQELQDLGRNGELGPAQRVYELLKEDITKLEEKLKGYTQPTKAARRARGGKRPPAGQQAE